MQFGLGLLVYGIVLVVWDLGFGCVINGQGIMQFDVVYKYVNIFDDEVIMICIVLGYLDLEFVVNEVCLICVDNEEFVMYYGFQCFLIQVDCYFFSKLMLC